MKRGTPMTSSNARKRHEADAHWPHHDPAVRELIEQAERRGAEKALREAADALGRVEDDCRVKRSCHLADQITLRERADQIGGTR